MPTLMVGRIALAPSDSVQEADTIRVSGLDAAGQEMKRNASRERGARPKLHEGSVLPVNFH